MILQDPQLEHFPLKGAVNVYLGSDDVMGGIFIMRSILKKLCVLWQEYLRSVTRVNTIDK